MYHTATTLLPAVGDRIRAYDIPGASAYNGHECVVTKAEDGIITGEFQSITKPDDSIGLSFINWNPVTLPNTTVGRAEIYVPADASVDTLRGIIETLSNDLHEERVQSQARRQRNNELSEALNDWQNDFNTYAERIRDEAIEREWCSMYDDIMTELQSLLRRAVIPAREQDWEIEVRIRANVDMTHTVTVTAATMEDAVEMFNDSEDDYLDADEAIRDAVRNHTLTFDDIEVAIED